MTNMENLQAIYREVLKKPDLQLTPELTARDVDSWDSLAHVQIIVEVEKKFGVEFDLDDFLAIRNVGDFFKLLARYGVDL
ncbi:MAG: acyl carrier protein [Magnetococcales bacterium]|nr:acyl carrier protein [Magnetococcales bacterium]